jgi:hypothetical protein
VLNAKFNILPDESRQEWDSILPVQFVFQNCFQGYSTLFRNKTILPLIINILQQGFRIAKPPVSLSAMELGERAGERWRSKKSKARQSQDAQPALSALPSRFSGLFNLIPGYSEIIKPI